MAEDNRPSSKEIIEAMCFSKKRGHRCVKPKGHYESGDRKEHHCFCGEAWEEVRT